MPQTGAHLWADRFDGSLEDVFELQDKVAISVAGVIEPALQAAENRRSAARPTNDLTAYDLYLRAYAMVCVRDEGANPEALRLLEQAIARDPHYGPRPRWAAHAAIVAARQKTERGSGSRTAGRASISHGGRWKWPATIRASSRMPLLALAYFGEDIGAMMALVDRALALNPNFARGWSVSGSLRLWAGQPDPAIEHARDLAAPQPRASASATRLLVIGIAPFPHSALR